MYTRFLQSALLDALRDSPVVLLNGARQTGKTTLVQSLPSRSSQLSVPASVQGPVQEHAKATYLTLDDAGFLAAARSDPAGFLSGFSGSIIIDEVQHAPELFPALKSAVDRQRTPGRFLLTGSANILLLPRLAESLAGRMQILTLWPLAQGEIAGRSTNVVDLLFAPPLPALPAGLASGLPPVERQDLMRRLLAGGYPEPLTRPSEARRRAWFGSYLTTILQRDVRDMANIEGLTALPRLLALIAARAASLLNLSDISRAAGLPYTTLTRYMSLLEATFLVQLIPAWSTNLSTRLVKSPKVILNDTGLMASLLGLNVERLTQDGSLFGPLLENFVAMEVKKHIAWSQVQPQLFHFRTQTGVEVDLVLENAAGEIVGLEVKASATVSAADFKGLRALMEARGERFVRGVVLYTGQQVIPFGERLHAVPISLLWI